MTVPINSEAAPIGPQALADLPGRWPAADGPLYRLLATRIGRLADAGELPPGIRLPPERPPGGGARRQREHGRAGLPGATRRRHGREPSRVGYPTDAAPNHAGRRAPRERIHRRRSG